ncbi:DUF3137 domain-containing protein [Parabacteroides sp. PF5-9]|uniref:DUF3137 domain-containing protein n=1 Tax=Parabacteroides sp. PF5-9 TaxID=1742404 RepID=UPI0024767E9E|nr:DUF3137 domain-containing protein [Parabacteroides sp. PF5-9]MDH6357951.1 hypothetical protein [Parabacteroides sp. PF5-9]
MHSNLSFEKLMDELSPILEQLESQRQKLRKEAFKKIIIGLIIIIVIVAMVSQYESSEFVFGIGFFVAVILISTVNMSRSGPLLEQYKKQIVAQIVKNVVKNGRYHPASGITENVFNQSQLFVHPDRYHSEDLISGVMDKTRFRFSEVHAEEKHTGSKGQTRWVTLFKGFMFIADFHKDFKGETVVLRNSFLRLKQNRVKLENGEFEKRFDVFSDDQVEARYLLTPSMMERIVELDKRFDEGVIFSFCRSNIMIAIHNETNHFEAGLWTKINDREVIYRDYMMITSLIAIIDELNLNTRIWTKN